MSHVSERCSSITGVLCLTGMYLLIIAQLVSGASATQQWSKKHCVTHVCSFRSTINLRDYVLRKSYPGAALCSSVMNESLACFTISCLDDAEKRYWREELCIMSRKRVRTQSSWTLAVIKRRMAAHICNLRADLQADYRHCNTR